jgi:cobalt/nickel transport system ATP-binding protein
MLLTKPPRFLTESKKKPEGVLTRLEHGKLIATHDLTFAEETCSRVILMKEGKLFADGDPKLLLYDRKLMEECGVEAIR